MTAAVHEGPVFGSALFVSARRIAARDRVKPAAAKAERVRFSRRPIGQGPRAILVTNPACRATPRAVRARPVARRRARRTPLYAGLVGSLLFSAAAFGLTFAVDGPRTLMSRGDYLAARQAIESQSRAAQGGCRTLDAPAREICRAEARAAERVDRAELDARYHGTVAAANDVRVARVKAQFAVARARCNAMESDQRLQCLHAARGDEARAMAVARTAAT